MTEELQKKVDRAIKLLQWGCSETRHPYVTKRDIASININ